MKTSNLKLKLVLGCALLLLMSSDLSAQFDLEDFDPTQHQTQYNSLPSVVESDQKLQQSPQFQACLAEAEEIVTRYEFNDLMGLRLIHRHFSLGTNQVMVERYEAVDATPSLVTQAFSLDEAKEMKALPSSWIFSNTTDKNILLFETSSDPAVSRARSAEKFPELVDEIGKTISKYNLNHLLSLAVLKRDSLIASKDQNYVETNASEQNRSVVQLGNIQDTPPKAISTSWSFKGPKKSLCIGCSHVCEHVCIMH